VSIGFIVDLSIVPFYHSLLLLIRLAASDPKRASKELFCYFHFNQRFATPLSVSFPSLVLSNIACVSIHH
jgi:hypothetical protein